MIGAYVGKGGELYRAGQRLWSAADHAMFVREYPDTPTPVIAKRLRRTVRSVYGRAKRFGLIKSAAYLASPAACRLRRREDGTHVGEKSWFPKGHVPANKGMRRPGWAPGRMAHTQFKKGNAPQTWVPIGTEVVDPDGYRKRKIADDRTKPSRFNWAFVHVLVWEAAHGPVRRGWAVVFKNGDKADIRLANLECITREALMLRNSVHNLPKPVARAVQLLGALNRQIRKRAPVAEKQD